MATNYSANQYERAYLPRYLQNWSPARPTKEKIATHEGYTQIIANDRGHLLPSVPRSKASPWGSFMGTWQMPLKIPPAQVALTARTTAAADSLKEWIHKNPDLLNACNGLRPEITGKECIKKGSWILRLTPGNNLGLVRDMITFLQQPHDPDSQKRQKKSVTKTVQQAPNPTIIPSSPVIQEDNLDETQSSHPSAGHTPGPQTPVNSPKNPPPSPC